MRKTFKALIGALFLVACSKPTLTIIGEDSANLTAIEKIAANYPGDVDIKFEAETFGDLLQKSNQDLALGTGRYDIILQYNFTLSSYVENDLVWNSAELSKRFPGVSTEFTADLFDAAWKEVGYYYSDPEDEASDPAPFGYPFATNTMLLAINQTLFDSPQNKQLFAQSRGRELTVPKTWQEFEEIAQFFTNEVGVPGVVLQGASGGWLYYEWAAIMASQGLHVYPDKSFGWERGTNFEASLSNPEVIAATTRYLQLRPYNGGGFENVDAALQVEILKRGQAAMGIVWSDFAAGLLEGTGQQFSLSELPGDYSPLAGGSFYINKDTRNAEEAYKFVTWLMQREQQMQLLRTNLGSPSASAYSSQILTESQFARAMQASVSRGTYAFEANKDSELVNTEVTAALQRAWRSPEDLAALFATADQNINRERRDLLAK